MPTLDKTWFKAAAADFDLSTSHVGLEFMSATQEAVCRQDSAGIYRSRPSSPSTCCSGWERSRSTSSPLAGVGFDMGRVGPTWVESSRLPGRVWADSYLAR
ncbi:hypothetical protein AYL99_11966 [Fonsecaea erecta]|uniref:Uncharacterized protein n=1 Tax=Fonsecaea erecta TaxID=1367422 RepID=A0A178Z3R9_9EURO|nr:hypothetical protein AYL99_11966 [Fonsecaea erecta]OAP53843.1 hypothetical protein AYL99_11966 [Fonsecaea erecta]